LRPSGFVKSNTSFGWGKGGNVTSAGWQVTLCDPMWHVSSRSGEGHVVLPLRTAVPRLLFTYFLQMSATVSVSRGARIVLRAGVANVQYSTATGVRIPSG